MAAAQVPDLYAVLGVTATATKDELHQAFHDLVRQHHPDTRRHSLPADDADLRLQQVLAAYTTLRDPARRAAYDRLRHRPRAAEQSPRSADSTPTCTPTSMPAPPRPTAASDPPLRVGPVHWTPAWVSRRR